MRSCPNGQSFDWDSVQILGAGCSRLAGDLTSVKSSQIPDTRKSVRSDGRLAPVVEKSICQNPTSFSSS